jgi:hypothetical protein
MVVSGVVTLNPRDALTRRTIGGKAVVSFHSHHYALLPWQEWRRELGRPLRLVSIDSHTDTNDAFQSYDADFKDSSPWEARPPWKGDEAARLAQLSAENDASVEAAVRDLRHDEHIDAAIRCGILDAAFILAHSSNEALEPVERRAWRERNLSVPRPFQEPEPEPPFTYEIPRDRMILLGDDNPPRDEEDCRRSRNQVIEAEFLRGRLAHAAEICRSANENELLAAPLVLDIDLDSFNTCQAIAPRDPSVFYGLIREAHAITIAQEPGWVDALKLDKELTASWLEQQLLAHISRALS